MTQLNANSSVSGMAGERSPSPRRRDVGITVIAAFKLFKGTLLLLIAFGALRLIHHSAEDVAVKLIQHLRADPNSEHLHRLLSKLLGVTDKKLELLSVGTFLYGSVFLVEGVGLLLQKRWAEYLTIITTAGLIPLEIYEIFRGFSAVKVVVLVINAGIVVYLILRMRKNMK